jgi:hypothetical protein
MKTAIVVIGVIILLIGVGLLAYGEANPIKTGGNSTSVLSPQSTRAIDPDGTWSPGAQVLSKGETVTAKFTITNYSSSMGPIFLYVQNLSQFIAWGGCAPCTSPSLVNQTLPSSGTFTLTWTVPYNDSYYFTFDNEFYNASAPAVFSANATVNSTTSSPNTTFLYSGVPLIIIGAIIIAIGLLVSGSRPPPSTKPLASSTSPSTTTT